MNFKALLNTVTNSAYTLPLVVLYVTEGCNLSCLTCSYRNPAPDELSLEDIEELAQSLCAFGLQHIVYSGGEPLFRRDFPEILRIFSSRHVKQSLLTNGLLLEKRLSEILEPLTEVIISLDGPSAAIHDEIRGGRSFDRIMAGAAALTARGTRPKVSIRCVIQKRNFRSLSQLVSLANDIGVDRISFLAPDMASGAFGRTPGASVPPDSEILLSAAETRELRSEIENLVSAHRDRFDSGFISESPAKLQHIVEYFEACAGERAFPVNRCNAPMVSAVVTATGDLLPCYFLPVFGNVRNEGLAAALNGKKIRETRNAVRQYSLERCKRCVCTLHVNPLSALMDKF